MLFAAFFQPAPSLEAGFYYSIDGCKYLTTFSSTDMRHYFASIADDNLIEAEIAFGFYDKSSSIGLRA